MRTSHRLVAAFCPLILLLAPVFGQAEKSGDEASEAAEVTATVAPQEVREVVAEGKAAIGTTGVLGARRAAEAQALRHAVEKALGIYVSAQSLTKNYVLVRDQVLTRADGFATLKEIVREEIGADEVSVTVRALVTLKPLAKQLKALHLTRAFRIFVETKGDREGKVTKGASEEPVAATTDLRNRLADAGFVVVDSAKNADLIVRLTPQFSTTHETPLDTAAGPMTMYAVDGRMTVEAMRPGTGEIVAAFSARDTANHVNLTTARSETAETAVTTITPRLIDSLMVLPAAQSQPVTLVVANLRNAAQVGKLEDALEHLTGVRKVTRRSFTGGVAQWEMDVLTEAIGLLARDLEEAADFRAFHLAITDENRSRIRAVATGKAAVRTVRGVPR